MRNQIAASVVVLSLFAGIALATGPPVISFPQIEAAAKSVAAQDRTPDQDTKAIKKSNTVIIVLLCVIVVGAGVYLIANNANKHGGSGLLIKRAERRGVPVEYRNPLLRQQWQLMR